MSRRNYNRIPLEQQAPPPPPPTQQEYFERSVRRGSVSGGNPSYRDYPSYRENSLYRNNPSYSNRRNSFSRNRYSIDNRIYQSPYYGRTFYNRNYRPQQRDNRQQQPHFNRNQNRLSRKRVYQPQPITLGDFLSSNSNKGYRLSSTSPVAATPANALPQRQQFAATTTGNNNNNVNTTQPFVVDTNQRQNQTTSAFRRRQRQQQQNNLNQANRNSNRFALLADMNCYTDIESDFDEDNNYKELNSSKKKGVKNIKTSKRVPCYLNNHRILKHFKNDPSLQDNRTYDGNKAYILNSALHHDEMTRAIYEIQLWQYYRELGLENNHWAKEIVRRTKKRDHITNNNFIEKKKNQLLSTINHTRAAISALQIQLTDYWTQISTRKKASNTSSSNTHRRLCVDIDQIDNSVKDYIRNCTKHVRDMIETRVQLAKAEMHEYKALEEFHKIADPLHWQIHLTIKPKIKTWSVKNKNSRLAQERVTHVILPKFIENVNLDFKVDESVLTVHEAQAAYTKMRVITHKFRTDAMELYVRTTALEADSVKNEINTIMKSFPKTNNEQIASHDKFLEYHELREKRLQMELKQSCYFLEVHIQNAGNAQTFFQL